MLFIIGLAIGLVLGYTITCAFIVTFYRVGTIRVDRSDPNDAPYLFLELDKGKGDISSKRYVLLSVDVRDYLPRK